MLKHVLGVDPSLQRTAAVYGATRDEFQSGYFVSSKAPPGVIGRLGRYELLVKDLWRWLPPSSNKADMVVIEGYAYSSDGVGAVERAEFGGLLRWHLLDYLVEGSGRIVEVAPNTLKLFATGNGRASKLEVVAAAVRKHGVKFPADDEYDAFWLYQIGLCALGVRKPEYAYETRALEGAHVN